VRVSSQARWQSNWTVLADEDAVLLDVGRSPPERQASLDRARALQGGTPVVLRAAGLGSSRRCRAFAAEAGIALEREYLALPSAAAPAYLVEDARASVRTAIATVFVTPPDARFGPMLDAALAVLRVVRPWRLVRWVAPGRVAVGTRA
jgi:hypothetical protein